MTRVAIIHEWLVKPGGSEQVLGHLARLFPQADIFPLVWRPGIEAQYGIAPGRIHPSCMQRWPGSRKFYKALLPFYPSAVEGHDLRDYDLVIANHHCVAHGARPGAGAPLVSYCHTPMRYAWDLRAEYLAAAGLDTGMRGHLINRQLDRLKKWDSAAGARATALFGNSAHTAARAQRAYGRAADFIYPAVALERFYRPASAPARGDHFLVVSRLVAYKRIEQAIEFCRTQGAPLRIVGDGPERKKLEALARGLPVQFLGRLPEGELIAEFQQARALLCPGEEDFGLSAVEAFAAGCPILHGGSGGFAEIATAVLGETANAMTLPSFSSDPHAGAARLAAAGAMLAAPENRDRLEELFGLPRFYAQIRAQIAQAAGADAVKPAALSLH